MPMPMPKKLLSSLVLLSSSSSFSFLSSLVSKAHAQFDMDTIIDTVTTPDDTVKFVFSSVMILLGIILAYLKFRTIVLEKKEDKEFEQVLGPDYRKLSFSEHDKFTIADLCEQVQFLEKAFNNHLINFTALKTEVRIHVEASKVDQKEMREMLIKLTILEERLNRKLDS